MVAAAAAPKFPGFLMSMELFPLVVEP
jgi:hypothetical protein